MAYRQIGATDHQRPAALTAKRRPKARIGPHKPRVLILPSAYGAFHQDLVKALAGRARVDVANALEQPALRRRRLRGADLILLDAVLRGEVEVAKARWDGRPPDVDVTSQLNALRDLALVIPKYDIVVGEWFDAGTMWASHLMPPTTRMVVRAHSLDVLDCWLHLMDWGQIDRIFCPHAAFAEVLTELTRGSQAPLPQLALPYRPDLARRVPERDPESRFVMGMIGWGRNVKDPHFALDLLELDKRRSLVLIGPPFPKSGQGWTHSYAESFRERLRDPVFEGRVTVVGQTRHVRRHLERVGVILSTSLREGWHLGLIEGAASGAVPVVRDWPLLASRQGAARHFPEEWVVDDLDEAHTRVTALGDYATWVEQSQAARALVMRQFAATPTAQAYRTAILSSPGSA